MSSNEACRGPGAGLGVGAEDDVGVARGMRGLAATAIRRGGARGAGAAAADVIEVLCIEREVDDGIEPRSDLHRGDIRVMLSSDIAMNWPKRSNLSWAANHYCRSISWLKVVISRLC